MSGSADRRIEYEVRDVPGYEGRYTIDTLGNVKSIVRNRLLNPFNHKGTLCVYLCSAGNRKQISVAKLMARTFLCEPPPGYIVTTKNHVKTDLRLENICMMPRGENSKITGTFCRKVVCRVDADGELIECFGSASDAASKLNYSTEGIKGRCRGIKNYTYPLPDGTDLYYEDDNHSHMRCNARLRRAKERKK